jgi:hypothetical protein
MWKVDLKKELEREEQLLIEAKNILEFEQEKDENIKSILKSGQNSFSPALERTEFQNIFHISSIEKLCVRYRLRFLNSSRFSGEIPYEAIVQVKELEKKYNTSFTNFKIAAPAERFMLKDSRKDPLLFAQIDDEHFLLIHQWGQDMNFIRRLAAFPFMNFYTLVSTCVLIAFCITALLPSNWLLETDASIRRSYLAHSYFFFLLSLFMIFGAMVYGVYKSNNFSSDVWQDNSFD